MTKSLLLMASMMFAMALMFSCSEEDNSCSSTSSPIDGGKGNDIANYKTKKIGDQTWMAENLDYAVNGSKCYNNDSANCTKYGRLYDWATAMAFPASCNSTFCASQINAKHRGICPEGWHIPSNDDWDALVYVAGGSYIAGKYLKATNGWSWNEYEGKSGNGTDAYGFTALPGGFGSSSCSFYYADTSGIWWSSNENGDQRQAYYLLMVRSYDNAGRSSETKDRLNSVRCVQD